MLVVKSALVNLAVSPLSDDFFLMKISQIPLRWRCDVVNWWQLFRWFCVASPRTFIFRQVFSHLLIFEFHHFNILFGNVKSNQLIS